MRILIQLTYSLVGLLVLAHDAISAITAQAVVATSNKTIYEKLPFCPPRFWNYSFIQYLPVGYTSFVNGYPDVRNSFDPGVASLAVESGWSRISYEMVHAYCSDFVQIGVVRRTLQNTGTPTLLKTVLNVFFLSPVMNTSTFTTLGFAWPTVDEDINNDPTYSLNITAITSEIGGCFFVLTTNKGTGAVKLHMFGFLIDLALSKPFNPFIIVTIDIASGKGNTATRMSIGVKTKTVSLYDTTTNKIHFYSYNQFTGTLAFNKTLDYEAGCTLQRLYYSYLNPFDWADTQIQYDDYTTVCANVQTFSIKTYRLMNTTALDWVLRNTVANEAATTAVAPIRIENGFMVGYYVKKTTTSGKQYHALKLVDVSQETSVSTLDEELVFADYADQDYEVGATLYGYYAYNAKQVHLFGFKYRYNYSDPDLNNRVLVSSRYYFGRTECFRSSCLMCLDNSAGPCFSCGYDYISWAGNCFLYTDTQPEGTYRLGSKYLDCTTSNCADCKANINVCVRCKYSDFEKYYLHSVSKQCLSLADILLLEGKGIDDANKQVVSCSQTAECKKCPLDYTKCQSCDVTSTKPYLYIDTCLAGANIPDGYGPDTVGSYNLIPCAIGSDCKTCKVDSSECTQCKDNTLTLMKVDSRTPPYSCTKDTTSNVTLGYGLNEDDFPLDVFVACAIGNCVLCRANSSECTGCKITHPYLGEYNGATQCNSFDEMIPLFGYGIASSTTFDACEDSKCTNCTKDNSVCVLCVANATDTFYLYEASTDPTEMCFDTTTIPDGVGIKNATSVVACLDSHCEKCHDAYDHCTKCDATYYLITNTTTSAISCILLADLPDGYGLDSLSDTVVPCSGTDNCLTCANAAICTVCKANYYLLHELNVRTVCWDKNSFEDGYGIVLPTTNIAHCKSTNCLECVNDHYNCSSCDTDSQSDPISSRLYLQPFNVTGDTSYNSPNPGLPVYKCVIYNDILTGYGAPLSPSRTATDAPLPSAVLKTCIDSNCADCRYNNQDCGECANSLLLDSSNLVATYKRCITSGQIAAGSGIVPNSFNVYKCVDSASCIECSSNVFECTQCDSQKSRKYLYDKACVDGSSIVLYYGKKDTPSTSRTLAHCSETDCILCQQDYTICTKCTNGKYLYTADSNKGKCKTTAEIPALRDQASNYYGIDPTAAYSLLIPCPAHCLNCAGNAKTCDQCESLYYPFKTGCILKTETNGLDGYGLDDLLTPTKYRQCDDTPHCLTCAVYYKNCTICDTGFTIIRDSNQLASCVADGAITENYGKNLSKNPVEINPCEDVNCKLCSLDNSDCTQCKTNFLWLTATNQSDSICIQPGMIPYGFGIDTSKPGYLSHCAIPNCDSCFNDVTVCSRCFAPLYLVEARTHCIAASEIPNGQGIQSGNTVLAKCLDFKCTKCVGNNLVCDVCAEGYRTTLAGACEPCTVTGCASCPIAASQCSLCTSAFGFFSLDANSNRACIANIAAIPTGFGIVTGTPEVRACSAGTANCKTCDVNDHTKCTACNNLYFLLHSSKACITAAAIPVGHGKDLTNPSIPMVKQCSVARCMVCTEDYQTCNNCSSTGSDALYKLTAGPTVSCLYSSELMNKGPNLLTFEVVSCSMNYCSLCNLDATVCQACTSPYRLLSQPNTTATCISTVTIPDPGFGYDQSDTTIIRACSSTRCLICKDNYKMCTECRDEYYLYPTDATVNLPGTCAAFSDIAAGYAVSTTLPKKLEACGVKCQTCSTSNPSVCLACKPNYFFYKKTPAATTVECLSILFTDITPINGFGKKGADLELQPCSEGALCISCWSNYLTCTSCLNTNPTGGATMYYNAAGATKCIDQSGIPAGSGPSTRVLGSDPTVAVGLQTCGAGVNCKTCNVNYATCIDCQTNYYLHTDGTCLGVNDMGQEGKGADLSTSNPKRTGRCTLDSCLVCSSDITKCTACGAGMYKVLSVDGLSVLKCFANNLLKFEYNSNLYGLKGSTSGILAQCPAGCISCMTSTCDLCQPELSLYQGGCITDANIPAGKGKTTVNGAIVIQTCVDILCADCFSDINICVTCLATQPVTNLPVFEHRVDGSDQVCFIANNLPAGWGAVLTTKKSLPCLASNCDSCKQDYSKCAACVAQAWVYERGAGDKVCYPADATTIPITYGKQVIGQVLASCSDTNCLDCFSDSTSCDLCKAGYLLKSDDNSCVIDSTVLAGFGPDFSNSKVPQFSKCAIDRCAVCTTSAISSCTACTSQWFVQLGTSTTPPKCHETIPAGYGRTTTGGYIIDTCKTTGCLDCTVLNTACTSCLKGMVLINNVCSNPVPTEGQGYDKDSNTYKTCTDANCLECRRDYAFCALCKLDSVLDPDTGKCYKLSSWSDFPDNKGVDGTSLAACTIEHCKRCPSSKSTCDECTTGYSLNVLANPVLCEPESSSIDMYQLNQINNSKVLGVQFDQSVQASVVTFANPIPDADYANNLLFMPFNKDGTRIKGVTIKTANLMESKREMVFEFDSSERYEGAIALLKSKSSSTATSGNSRLLVDSGNPFDTGVVLKDLTFGPVSVVKSTDKLSIAVTVVLSVVSLASFKHSRFYGFKLVYYHTLLGSLSYLTVQKPAYVRGLLEHLDWTLASFIPLPETSDQRLKCVPTASWLFSDISCFVYNNLNKYVILFVVLFVLLNVLRMMSSGKSALTDQLKKYFDSSFFFKYYAAVAPAWMFASLVNIYYGATSATMAIGMFISVIIMILYFAWLVASIRNHLLIRSGRSEVGFAVAATIVRLKSDSPAALLAHIVDLLKTVAYLFFVVFLQKDPQGQSIAAIIIFLISLIYIAAVRPYSMISDNIFVIMIELMFVVLFIISASSAKKASTMLPNDFENTFSIAYFIFFFAIVVLMILWFIKLFIKPKDTPDYNVIYSTPIATFQNNETIENKTVEKVRGFHEPNPEISNRVHHKFVDEKLPPISQRPSQRQSQRPPHHGRIDVISYPNPKMDLMSEAHLNREPIPDEPAAHKLDKGKSEILGHGRGTPHSRPESQKSNKDRTPINQVKPMSSSSKDSRASRARLAGMEQREPIEDLRGEDGPIDVSDEERKMRHGQNSQAALLIGEDRNVLN